MNRTKPLAAPVAAETCTTMAEVRAGIDALDRELVALLARRQGYIEAAARIKPRADLIRDEARIAEVIGKVLREAETAGLSPDIAEPVWRALIEASIAHEHEGFRLLQASGER